MRNIFLVFFLAFLSSALCAQQFENDKCGVYMKAALEADGNKWGYSYDSLINDLDKWNISPFVQFTSIGRSTQEREIYELTISNFNINENNKHRVYIHARTHPGEIQSHWVTNEIINFLLSEGTTGNYLRDRYIFHVVPMVNPDGVELEFPRENANGIDIESNWNSDTPEAEVGVLKNRFTELMSNTNPIMVALNMHSAIACRRYFVYHHENGTSLSFTDLEKEFIGGVRSHFINGIEPHNYYVSWTGGTPYRYPESWWWHNYNDAVMALTYEDMNCNDAGFYDKTAFAILYGISDYIEFDYEYPSSISDYDVPLSKVKAYPNPFEDEVTIEWNNFEKAEQIQIYDMMGRMVNSYFQSPAGGFIWDGTDSRGVEIASGVYVARITFESGLKTTSLIKR